MGSRREARLNKRRARVIPTRTVVGPVRRRHRTTHFAMNSHDEGSLIEPTKRADSPVGRIARNTARVNFANNAS